MEHDENPKQRLESILRDHNLKDPSDHENKALTVALDNKDVEVAMLILKDPRVDPSLVDNYAIKYSSMVLPEFAIELLKDERIDPSVNNNFIIAYASRFGSYELAEALLNDPRVDPSDNNNKALRWALDVKEYEIVKLLLTDPRVGLTKEQIEKLNLNEHPIEIINLLKMPYKLRLKQIQGDDFSNYSNLGFFENNRYVMKLKTFEEVAADKNNLTGILNKPTKWQGEKDSDGKFEEFEGPEWSLRATMIILANYVKRHGISELTSAISRWRFGKNDPKKLKDAEKKELANYVNFVKEKQKELKNLLGFEDLNFIGMPKMNDDQSIGKLAGLVVGISMWETGSDLELEEALKNTTKALTLGEDGKTPIQKWGLDEKSEILNKITGNSTGNKNGEKTTKKKDDVKETEDSSDEELTELEKQQIQSFEI